ncbi:MAG TPA: Xaa-Pro peptidase family protein [Acidimicrobiia bacterium]|nr:Xaa-Pro peptidase family protein [Acidimicrobiia bacterium]
MQSQVVSRLRPELADHDLDAIVCISPENVAYTAGFVVPSQPLMRWRHAMTVIDGEGRTAVVCVDMEETTVRNTLGDTETEVRVWREFIDHRMSALVGLLRDWGHGDGRVGIELDYLPVSDHDYLLENLPELRLVEADSLLQAARRIKTPREIALLEQLSRISDTAIRDAFDSVSAGSTEMDLAATLTRRVYEQGAQQFKLMIVATGERSQLPNVGPTTRVLEPGDICRVEIFSVIDGYHAGVCRTAVVGEPSPIAEQVYANLVQCKHEVFAAMKPGASSREIYELFSATFRALGMPAISFVAHSIGVNLHEPPYFGPHSDQPVAPGMVLAMEPLVYQSGHGFGMQIKDMIAIEDDGARLLSDVTDTDHLYRIRA